MDEGLKPVDFSYCNTCKYWPKDEEDYPCDECLNTFGNSWTHKPVKYEEKKTKKA